jgi:hypothetical protein
MAATTGGQGQSSGARRTRAPALIELRTLRLRIGQQQKLADNFLAEVELPALGRLGVGPVGVFEVVVGMEMPTLLVLVPHESAAAFAATPGRLAADPTYSKAAAALAFHGATSTAPAFDRMDSALLVAFDNMPAIEPPPETAAKQARVFELRTYGSHAESACAKKIEMFTRMGETEIFRRVGLRPVFFAKAVVGPRLPHFTYMLSFPDMAARDKAWATFRADPEWKKLKATPGYADAEVLTHISDLLLRPTAYSQV